MARQCQSKDDKGRKCLAPLYQCVKCGTIGCSGRLGSHIPCPNTLKTGATHCRNCGSSQQPKMLK
ncbi:MAG: hypothetical protein OHK0013_15170 [Sandaracinaceae bacterium]